MYDLWIDLVKGEWASFVVGIGGLAVVNLFGWLLRRPISRQAVKTQQQRAENDRFKTQIEGYESLVRSLHEQLEQLHNQIEHMQTHDKIRAEYEDVLIAQLRQARSQELIGGKRAGDPSSRR